MAILKTSFIKTPLADDDTCGHAEDASDANLTQVPSNVLGAYSVAEPCSRRPFQWALLNVVGIFLHIASLAQTAPSAGALLQQIEESRILALPKAQPLEIVPAPAEMKTVVGVTVVVQSFRLVGNRMMGQQLDSEPFG